MYQTDFLIRKYGFAREDILCDRRGNLRLDKDPKEVWAERHPECYPVRLNTSGRDMLLKVPGLGPETVARIMEMRKEGRISGLHELGVKGRRLDRIRKYVVLE